MAQAPGRHITADAGEGRTESRREAYTLFAIVVLACSFGGLSQNGLNAMLGIMCVDLGVPTTTGQWLTTAYIFVLGVVVPLSSFLLGRFRMKDLLLATILMFTAGAGVACVAPSFAGVLAGRLIQAVAAGVLMPLVQTVVMTHFPSNRQGTAMGISGIALGFAPNIGPTIGGVLVDAYGWRSFFVFLLVAGLILAVLCLAFVRRRDDASFPSSLDLLSFVLSTVGFGGLLVGCTEASTQPLASPLVWGPVVIGAVSMFLFVRRQRRVESPLIDMGIFSSVRYRWGFVASSLLFASFISVTLLIPLFIEDYRGGSALQAGMVLLPATIAALVVNPLAGWLTDRIGARKVTLVAGTFLFTGAAMMAFCNADTPLWAVMAMQGVRAMGVSGLIGPLTSWGLSELRGKTVADGSAFVTVARQAAASVGTALMVVCVELASPVFEGAVPYQLAFALSAVLALGSLVCIIARVGK